MCHPWIYEHTFWFGFYDTTFYRLIWYVWYQDSFLLFLHFLTHVSSWNPIKNPHWVPLLTLINIFMAFWLRKMFDLIKIYKNKYSWNYNQIKFIHKQTIKCIILKPQNIWYGYFTFTTFWLTEKTVIYT